LQSASSEYRLPPAGGSRHTIDDTSTESSTRRNHGFGTFDRRDFCSRATGQKTSSQQWDRGDLRCRRSTPVKFGGGLQRPTISTAIPYQPCSKTFPSEYPSLLSNIQRDLFIPIYDGPQQNSARFDTLYARTPGTWNPRVTLTTAAWESIPRSRSQEKIGQ